MQDYNETHDGREQGLPASRTTPHSDSTLHTKDEADSSLAPDLEIQNLSKNSVREISGLKWTLVVSAIVGSTFLYALDNTVVADVGANVILSLGGLEKLPWLGTAFTWAAMSTVLVWSKLYTLFDAKILYLVASVIFEVGSALCGAAPNMDAMIVGRAIAGLGASGIYVGSLTLLSVNTTEQERPTYIGYTGLSWGSGFVLGPVIGGAFAGSNATWRWAFYLNLVLFAFFGPILLIFLPRWDPKKGTPFIERVKQIDWLGSILEIGATLAGIMAISFGGTVYLWNSGQTIGLFVTCVVLFILFFAQQRFTFLTSLESRIFPLQFLGNKYMMILWTMIAAPAAAVLGPIYFIPIFFQFVHGDSPIDAAVRLLPVITTFVFFGLSGGFVVSKTGRYYPWFVSAGVLSTAGACVLYADINIGSEAGKLYGYSALIGIGCGAAGQLSYSYAQFKVPVEQISSTIGFICMGQYVGLTVALCICGAVFNNYAQNDVAALLPVGTPIETVRGVIQGVDKVFLSTQTAEIRTAVLEAVVDAIKRTYSVSIAAGALMIGATLLLKNEKIIFKK